MSARIEYAAGEAWCIAAGRTVLVCERDLPAARARTLHASLAEVESVDALRAVLDAEPSALIGLVDLTTGRALLRRHGVPATSDGTGRPDRFGADWSVDEIDAGATVAAGGLGSLDGDCLPFEGGVARVSAVRVAPWAADASASSVAEAPVVDEAEQASGFGAFGQTLPPAVTAGSAPNRAPDVETAGDTDTDPGAEDDAAIEADPGAGETRTDSVSPTMPTAQAPSRDADPSADNPSAGDPSAGNPIAGLIDSVPGFIKPAADVRELRPAPEPAPEPAPRAAAPDDSGAPAHPTAPDAALFGDHDGMTITAEQARRLHAERTAQAGTGQQTGAPRPASAPATGPLVLSTLCPSGHVNPPGTTACITCGAGIDEGSAAQRPRPEVAVAVLPSGERIPLGRGVVIGRRPRSRRVEDGRVPRLVTVDSPGEDISRSHVELRVDDWNLVAIDLSSTNGTLLLRDGAAPQRLRPEASTILQLGDRLDLGEGHVVTIEPAP